MLSYTANLIKTSVPGYRALKYTNKVEQAKNLIAKIANLKTVRKDSTLKKQISSISKQKRVKFKKRQERKAK